MPANYDSPQSHTDTDEGEHHGGRDCSSNEPSSNAACVRPHSRPPTTVLNDRRQGPVITAAKPADMTEQRGNVAAYDSTTAINGGRGTLQDACIEGRDGDGAAVAAVEDGETQAEGISSGRTNLPITRSLHHFSCVVGIFLDRLDRRSRPAWIRMRPNALLFSR